MKLGDLVKAYSTTMHQVCTVGIIVAFNKKGEGGKDFVHILAEDGTIMVFNAFDVEVINANR